MKCIYAGVFLGLLSEGYHENKENPQYLIESYFCIHKSESTFKVIKFITSYIFN